MLRAVDMRISSLSRRLSACLQYVKKNYDRQICVLVFLDEGQQEVHRLLKFISCEFTMALRCVKHSSLVLLAIITRQASDNITQQIVDGVIGPLRQLIEEKLSERADFVTAIIETHHHEAHLSLHLDHVV